jgi:hypothetical protein
MPLGISRRVTRRQFLAATSAALGGVGFGLAGCQSPRISTTPRIPARKKIALIGTVVRRHSHAQHFIDRFLEGYGWGGQWHHPTVDLVSLYIDQFPQGDLARERSKRFNVPLYSSVEEALTCGGSKLAVDGIVIIGEHGDYPRTSLGQTIYPRYAWFKRIVKIFEGSGRSVPVFNDKHLSTNWTECIEMVADSRRLNFPFHAGSSLPVTWRIPSIDFPLGRSLRESVNICYGGVDSYDFHGIETAQCMSERRRGGESGIKSVVALEGDKLWDALAARDQTRRLFFAALARSHTVRPADGYTVPVATLEAVRKISPKAIGYFYEHVDGLKTAMFLCNGLVQDFTYAGLAADPEEIISCQMQLPMPLAISTTADFFNPLVHHIETMVNTGKAPYPIERTLLTSGMTLSAVQSLRSAAPVQTPEMNVSYRATRNSTFWNV